LFSQDGDEVVRIWDLASERLLWRIPCDGHDSPSLAISPDGRRFAVAGANETRIYELRSSSAAVAFQYAPLISAALSETGESLACVSERMESNESRESIHSIWDIATDALRAESSAFVRLRSDQQPILMPHDGAVNFGNVIWTGPRETVVAGAALPPRRVAAGAPEVVFPAVAATPVLVFQEDAFRFEGAAQVEVDATAAGGKAARLSGQGKIALALQDRLKTETQSAWLLFAAVRCTGGPATEPEVLGGLQAAGGSWMHAWDRTWRPDPAYQWFFVDLTERGWIESHDGAELAIQLQSSDGDATLWVDCVVATPLTPRNDRVARHFPICSLAHVPEHSLVLGVVDHQNVTAWRTPGMQMAWEQHNSMATIIAGSNQLNCLTANRDWIAVGTERGDLLLLHTATGGLEKLHSGAEGQVAIHAVCMVPGQPLCAVGDANGALKLVRLPEGDEVFRTEAHHRSIDALAASGDGRMLVSGGRGGTVRVWRCEGSRLQPAFALPECSGPIRSVSLDSRGDTLAIAVQGERAVRLWKLNHLAEEFAARGLTAGAAAPSASSVAR
jgi:WD40 repeat protein